MKPEALAFLDGLDPDVARSARFPFPADEVRRQWTYLPGQRPGLSVAEMDRDHAAAAYRLLASGLSEIAYAKACAIVALENVLDRQEGHGLRRHAGDYWVAVFGDPDGEGPWAWRFEGHHVSVNTCIVDDAIARTPLFLGANPARIERGGVAVSAPLEEEEALGFRLVNALDGGERAAAVISATAPDDIVTTDSARVDPTMKPEGVRIGDLGGEAAAVARELVDLYLGRVPGDPSFPSESADVRFAWAGEITPGAPHYYRLHGPRFLVELDNTQNDANHIHTVWRDPDGDFGDDLLAEHYRAHHGDV